MKYFGKLVLLMTAVVFCWFSILPASSRLVVGEVFTGTSWGACYYADLVLDRLASDYEPNLVLVRYHIGAEDPFYYYNSAESWQRSSYYGNNSMPHLFINGNIDGSYYYGMWEMMFLGEMDVSSPLAMSISGIYNPALRKGEATVEIIAEEDPGLSNLTLRIALTESDIFLPSPNGTEVHNQTFRDMIPTTFGVPISLSGGDTVRHSFDFSAPLPLVPENCELVAFVQSNSNKRILQGARLKVDEIIDIEEKPSLALDFSLHQNYPNPFNVETKIAFESQGGALKLEIFDLTGASIRTLVDGVCKSGPHSIVWNGLNDNGKSVASGVYFYRLSNLSGSSVKKMTLLR